MAISGVSYYGAAMLNTLTKFISLSAVIFGLSLGVIAVAATDNKIFPDMGFSDWGCLLGFVLLGLGLLSGSLIAVSHARTAGKLLLLTSLTVLLLLMPWAFKGTTGARIMSLSVVFFLSILAALPGLFWFLTARRNWPNLLNSSSALTKIRVVLFFPLFAIGVFGAVYLPLDFGDCQKEVPPFTAPRGRNHAVFTATVVRVGRPVGGSGLSHWGLVKIDHQYWGVPNAWSYLVMRVPLHKADEGSQFFIDAHRMEGLWTRFLPVVEVRSCNATTPLRLAVPYLRALNEPTPNGARVIGIARTFSGKLASGVEVTLAGPAGELHITTDSSGLYDFNPVPPGHYVLTARNLGFPSERHEVNLGRGRVWGVTLYARD